jgi:hypothetical protein
MDTTHAHHWTISAIDAAAHRGATAATLNDAWLQALTAGRAALLGAHLDTLAITINGELEALYSPGRDARGLLDPAEITADLVDIHQSTTAADIAEQLIAG